MDGRMVSRGLGWGMAAALLTAGWWVMGRHGVTRSLSPLDMAVLRFAVSGLVLAPVLWRGRALLRRASPALVATLAACGGAPYSMVVAEGLRGATAGNAGALVSGLLPLFGAVLSAVVFRERIRPGQAAGLALVAAAALLLAAGPGMAPSSALLLACGALMAAGFSVALKRSGLPPLVAISLVCVTSAAVTVPAYLAFAGPAAFVDTLAAAWPQAAYQGVVSAIGAVYCFSRAVLALGASRASLFAALVPVATTALAALSLGESPGIGDCAILAAIMGGSALASGAVRSTLGLRFPGHHVPGTDHPRNPARGHGRPLEDQRARKSGRLARRGSPGAAAVPEDPRVAGLSGRRRPPAAARAAVRDVLGHPG